MTKHPVRIVVCEFAHGAHSVSKNRKFTHIIAAVVRPLSVYMNEL